MSSLQIASTKGRTVINLPTATDPVQFQSSPPQIIISPDTGNGEASIRFNTGVIGGTAWVIGKNVAGVLGNFDIARSITQFPLPVLSCTSTGDVIIPNNLTAGSLTFTDPTSTPLSSHEFYSQVINFTISGRQAGSATLNITKIGNLVSMSLIDFIGQVIPFGVRGHLVSVESVPDRFLIHNSNTLGMVVPCLVGSMTTTAQLSTTGVITICSNTNGTGSILSVGPITISWVLPEPLLIR